MARAEGAGEHSTDDGKLHKATATPYELVITKEGTEIIYEVEYDCPEARNGLLEQLDEIHGERTYDGTRPPGGFGKLAFGFSSSSWNSAWNPEGPTPNWRKPPPDPTLN